MDVAERTMVLMDPVKWLAEKAVWLLYQVGGGMASVCMCRSQIFVMPNAIAKGSMS